MPSFTHFHFRHAVNLAAFAALALISSRNAMASPSVTVEPPPSASGFAEQRTQDLQAIALALMTRGRRFDLAVAELTEVVRREPKNKDAQLSLGSALASQALVLSRYQEALDNFAWAQNSYAMKMQQWDEAQRTTGSPPPGMTMPTQPTAPTTIDGSHCTLSGESLLDTIKVVAQRAEANLGFVYPAPAKGDEDRATLSAQQLDLRAWSKILLRIGAYRHMEASGEIQALRQSLHADLLLALAKDDSVRQKKCVGDALVISCTYHSAFISIYLPEFNQPPLPEGLRLLSEVAAKAPDRAPIWFFIGSNQLLTHTTSPLPAWKSAEVYGDGNALYPYACAAAIASDAMGDLIRHKPLSSEQRAEVDAYLRKGASCSALQTIPYPVAAPPAVRWLFRDYRVGGGADLMSLLSLLEPDVQSKMKAQDYASACDLTRQIAAIGAAYQRGIAAPQVSETERSWANDSAKLFLSDAGTMIMQIRITTSDMSLAKDLDYCLDYMPERSKQWYRQHLP